LQNYQTKIMKIKYLIIIVLLFVRFGQTSAQSISDESKEGILLMEVKNFEDAKKQIDQLVLQYNSNIIAENENKYSARISNEITIRVSNKNFNSLTNDITKLASTLNSKQIKIINVDKELVDAKERIRVKKELKEKYIQMIHEAQSSLNISQYEKKVAELEDEMDQLQNKIKYLSEPDKSTLKITISQQYLQQSINMNTSYNDIQVGTFKTLLIKIGLYSIILLIVIILAIFWIKRFQKEQKRKTSKTKFLNDLHPNRDVKDSKTF